MKKLLLPLLSLLLILSLMIGGSAAASVRAERAPVGESLGETLNRNNINGNSYNRYTDVVRSYLQPVDGGYMRIYGNDDGTLLAEYYDENFTFVSNRYVDTGLPLFGGFYTCGGRYYVLTGEDNPDEDENKEVFRITCFDENWEVCDYDSLYGANTVNPFKAGRASFADYGDHLIIRTCHRIYAIDGVNHQTNMTIVYDMKQNYIKDYCCDIAHIKTAGYLSHSFNQFIAIDDDGTVVCLDHGDAHPRVAALGRFLAKADHFVIRMTDPQTGRTYQTYEHTPIFSYYGELGDNDTAAMIGGLACSSTAYLTVGTIAGQDENYKNNTAFNAYISVTGKNVDDMENAETKIVYLSSFEEGDGRYSSNPQLVKLGSDRFLVMWNEFPVGNGTYLIDDKEEYDSSHLMKYVFIDGEGNLTSAIMTAPAGKGIFVSECEPVVDHGRILWYVGNGESLASIIEMDLSGRITVHENVIPDGVTVYPFNLSKAYVAFRSFDKIPEGTDINEDNIDDYVVVYYQGRPLVRGKDYRLANVAKPITVTSAQGTVSRITLRLAAEGNCSFLPLSYTTNWSATDNILYLNSPTCDYDGVHLNVIARRGIGYHVYRKEANSADDYALVATVADKYLGDCVDGSAEVGKRYSYIVREFTYDRDGSEVLSEPSAARTVKVIYVEPPTEAPTKAPTEPPTEAPTDPPTEAPTEAPSDPPTEAPTDPAVQEPVLLGDADRDQAITILDATCIQRRLAGLNSEDQIDSYAADADLDNDVTILDATTIQRHLAGFSVATPIGERFYPNR